MPTTAKQSRIINSQAVKSIHRRIDDLKWAITFFATITVTTTLFVLGYNAWDQLTTKKEVESTINKIFDDISSKNQLQMNNFSRDITSYARNSCETKQDLEEHIEKEAQKLTTKFNEIEELNTLHRKQISKHIDEQIKLLTSRLEKELKNHIRSVALLEKRLTQKEKELDALINGREEKKRSRPMFFHE